MPARVTGIIDIPSSVIAMPTTLFDKIWRTHLVHDDDGLALLYIDLHLVHEVTSPQAFESLRLAGRRVRNNPRRSSPAPRR